MLAKIARDLRPKKVIDWKCVNLPFFLIKQIPFDFVGQVIVQQLMANILFKFDWPKYESLIFGQKLFPL